MRKNLLVSVIIPVYNGGKFLEESINSIRKQTYEHWEIIIVDDGSTDDTLKIANNLKEKNPQRIFVFSKSNGGQASARNVGMKNAKGEFIAFLDADDIWLPDKIEKQLQRFAATNADLCFTDAEMFGAIHAAKKHFSEFALFPEGDVLKELLKTNFIVNSSVLMKRKVFQSIGYQKEGKIFRNIEDYDYWVRAALRHFNFVFFRKPLVRYRVHEGQSTKANEINSERGLFFMFLCYSLYYKIWALGAGFICVKRLLIHCRNLFLMRMKSITKKSLFFRWFLLFREYQNYRRWKKYIDPTNPSPPPHVKRMTILKEAQRLRAFSLIETGTNRGDTPFFLNRFFKKIYTIELDDKLFEAAKKRLVLFSNIKVYHGDSVEILAQLLASFNETVVFWLDAHYSGYDTARSGDGDTPIEGELNLILSSKLKNYSILIDDAYLFGSHPAYPSIDKIKSLVNKLKPNLKVEVKNQIICIKNSL